MPEYWWFEGETVAKLATYLSAAKEPRLIVKLDPTTQAMTLEVTGMDRVRLGGVLNESHPCPPDCGG